MAMPYTLSRTKLASYALVLALGLYWLYWLRKALLSPLTFDDAYMFYRYAINIRRGLGMSWNLNGVHTYGETSALWGLVVVLLSMLPVSIPRSLIIGSWMGAVFALFAMTWAVSRNAKSDVMKRFVFVLPMVAVPLLLPPIHAIEGVSYSISSLVYMANAVTGMETMLGAAFAALYLGLVLGWSDGRVRAPWVSVTGILLFLTRPETALVIVILPVMLTFRRRLLRPGLATILGIFFGGVLLDLLFCKFYFQTFVPLSFYMKSGHAYEGYHATLHPLRELCQMLFACGPFLILIAVLARRSDLRLIASCFVPTALTFCYLCTVTQIMGWNSRYYAPYFPLIVVPSLLVVDRRMEEWRTVFKLDALASLLGRRALILGASMIAVVLIATRSGFVRSVDGAERYLENRPYIYDPVKLEISAPRPLPEIGWYRAVGSLGRDLIAPLPAGATIAASEVGYLGVVNLNIDVIDMEGLNDNQIALGGFHPGLFFDRKPDIIWIPHQDYTYQRGVLFTSPALLENYNVYADAMDYGIAIRKDSPFRAAIDQQWKALWERCYPGYRMDDYLVRSASWTGEKHKVVNE